jgi:hypothetical protein
MCGENENPVLADGRSAELIMREFVTSCVCVAAKNGPQCSDFREDEAKGRLEGRIFNMIRQGGRSRVE